MKFRVWLLASAIALLCVVAVPAAAEPPIGSRLGERLERDAVKKQRDAAFYAQELARCLVNKQSHTVRRFLGALTTEERKRLDQDLSGEHECFNMTEGNDLVEERMVTYPPDVFRGMLSEWMIKNDEGTFAALPDLPRQLIYSRTWYPATDRDVSVDEMATCVSEMAPGRIISLLKTDPYSDSEASAFSAVVPYMGGCLRAGVKLTGNRQSLRAALADALYQRVANPPPAASPAQTTRAK